MSIDPETILHRLIVDHRTFNAKGEQLKVTGTVSLDEAHYIRNLIVDHGFTTCLETGVAYVASTVAICHGLSLVEKPFTAVKHYGVDPCEINVYGGPALAALKAPEVRRRIRSSKLARRIRLLTSAATPMRLLKLPLSFSLISAQPGRRKGRAL